MLVLALVIAALPGDARAGAPEPVRRAECGPGAIPERSQGRVTEADYAEGLRCNIELLGRTGPAVGGYRTHVYRDTAGNECAYFDTSPILAPERLALLGPDATGTFVVDLADPIEPVVVKQLVSPAMASPHESLSLHAGRGLLAANMGTGAFLPGMVDVYDISADCRDPVLLSSTPFGIAGHEGSFSPDGMTYWVTSSVGFTGRQESTIAAVDVADPARPRLLWASATDTAHGLNLSADGKTLFYADVGPDRGLTVLDVTEVQARVADPQVREIARLSWATGSQFPQTAIPVVIRGRNYLVEVDEFTQDTLGSAARGSFSDPGDAVGAARLIDVQDPSRPRVVSDLRLEVNSPKARAGSQSRDPAADSLFGYVAHYCAVPSRVDPGIVACSFVLSGLRVFDIRDPARPVEIAYFNPPGSPDVPYRAMSAPAFVPERDEIVYTDGNYGFFTLALTNGARRRSAARGAR